MQYSTVALTIAGICVRLEGTSSPLGLICLWKGYKGLVSRLIKAFIVMLINVIYYVMCICVFVAFCILCAPIAVKQIAPLETNKGID